MRWIIFGTGNVARKFVLDLGQTDHQVVAVASRNPDNAARFVATLGLAARAGDYDTALKVDADAVYIATPPAQHAPHALAAIAAGRAVLVEKPFAHDAAEAGRIREAAQDAGVFAMEAMWTRFQPLIAEVRARIEAGALGQLSSFDARFLAANHPDPASGLFDPAQGGGALLHRGIYPLSVARHLLGPVTEVTARARLAETGVDEETIVLLRHENGALSTIRASLRTTGFEDSTLGGTDGRLTLEGPIYRPVGAYLSPVHATRAGQGGPRRFEAFRESARGLSLSRRLSALKARRARQLLRAPWAGNGYHYEAVAVAQALAQGQTEHPLMPVAESIEILRLIDEAHSQIGRTP